MDHHEETTSTAFAALEAAWVDLMAAYSRRLVDPTRGLPVDRFDYDDRRRAIDPLLAAVRPETLSAEERAGLECIRAAIASGDDDEPIDGAMPALPERTPEAPDIAVLRRATYDAYGAAADAVRIGNQTVDRPTALARMAVTADPDERRAIFEALEPVYEAVDADGGPSSPYRRLVAASAERWARDGSPIDRNAAELGVEPADFEGMLREILAAGRRALDGARESAAGRLEPWDLAFVMGEADRRLDALIPANRLRAINDAHLRALGADPVALQVGYDIEPRPGRPPIPVAFSTMGAPGPWVFATYAEGGLGNLAELLHESGHALHYAAIETRPAFREPPPSFNAFFEAVADVVGWDADEPAFQLHHLGAAVEPAVAALSRGRTVLLDVCWTLFEIELHRTPDRRPNDVWAEIVADGLGIEPHPERSWWAIRGQLIDAPGWMANYALSAIGAAAIRAAIRARRGDWSTGDPGWFAFVSESLLRYGGERSPSGLIRDLIGGLLDAGPLLADLARAT